jgi:hypothetical protein
MSEPTLRVEHALPLFLDTAVRLRILALQEMDEVSFWREWRAWMDDDALTQAGLWNEGILFGGKAGEAATAFNAMAKAVAALAFVPEGVTMFNTQYVATRTYVEPDYDLPETDDRDPEEAAADRAALALMPPGTPIVHIYNRAWRAKVVRHIITGGGEWIETRDENSQLGAARPSSWEVIDAPHA